MSGPRVATDDVGMPERPDPTAAARLMAIGRDREAVEAARAAVPEQDEADEAAAGEDPAPPS